MAFVRAMYKKGAGNDKQGKDAGNRTLCPYRNFSQAINSLITGWTVYTEKYKSLGPLYTFIENVF